MSGVMVKAVTIQGVTGYDVAVTNESATVQDYLDALNEAIDNPGLYRGRARRRVCKGCDLCCAERLPLTSIDVYTLRAALVPETTLNAWLARYARVCVDGRVVDIIMNRLGDDRCCLLDRKTRLCGRYAVRPLVCQTFVCSPQTRRASRLRETVVNKGEDQLVREWLLEAKAAGIAPVIHEARRPAPRIEDYPATPFQGKTEYGEVRLKDLSARPLWHDLTER